MSRWFSFIVICVLCMLNDSAEGETSDCVCNLGYGQDIYADQDTSGAVLGRLTNNECITIYLAGTDSDSLFLVVQEGMQVGYILNTEALRVKNCTLNANPVSTGVTSTTIPTKPVTVPTSSRVTTTTQTTTTTSTAATTTTPTPPRTTTTLGCPAGYVLLDGGCYIFKVLDGDETTWNNAMTYCHQLHGHLAFINSDREQRAMQYYMQTYVSHSDHHYWIGATDQRSEGHWEWLDPGQLNAPGVLINAFTYWYPGQPNNLHNDDCAAMKGHDLEWVDNECSESYRFVCETSPVTVHATVASPLSSNCELGWVYHGDHCYLFKTSDYDKLTWNDAQTQCARQGSHLMFIESSSEQTFVYDKLQQLIYPRRHEDIGSSLWIGATDAHHEGHWTWADGTSTYQVSYTHWSHHEPNNYYDGNEDCAVVRGSKNYQWNDYPCRFKLNYICEKASASSTFNIIG